MAGTSLAEMNPEEFGVLQRMARAFSESTLIPEEMRTIANCTVALLMAHEMHENPVMVMQNIFSVHGRPGWMAQYMISRANTSGRFRGPLRFRTTGEGDDLTVTCRAELRDAPDDDCRVEQALDLKTAKELGWTTYKDRKDNFKIKTHDRWATPKMQEQMLSWRAATWLIRKYAPEVMFGLPTADELSDIAEMKDVTPERAGLDDFKPSGGTRRTPAAADQPPHGKENHAGKDADIADPPFGDARADNSPSRATQTREEVMRHNPVSGDDNAAAPAVAGADPADDPLYQGYAEAGSNPAAATTTLNDDLDRAALHIAALERMDLHVPFEEGRAALWVPLAITKLRRMQKDHAPAADYEMFKAINFAALAAVRERHPQHHRDIEALIAKGKAS